ncbi:heat-inducible transcriptional repressor HrcA [Tepidimicrobium xylanilyticum]|uniref:Heat-inducible transcription repressor HrcA n=1 Tax=Tepidimicrobium xylanilyticum TaxID=1123352 RepID=A0A1H2T4M1_9FIRM|nr:heat-inducible transcriptional repressor HrcA [Tepidimicrobium xylanilyticum]GMG96028.1 heat-inducible transcription repressor HrcA [Tepidimicrobium xylanilyticum]SDW38831.1 heat-inducible transcription repressor HrcA [Tepidimicrobium xylanilyticum]
MLDERKIKVLYAIIDSYLMTAEPIGSRTISKNYNLGVSSATIRNEMSDLEELGYLSKPHTSSGRIPSDKAYRLYVDQLLKTQKLKIDMDKKEKIKQILTKESKEIDQLIQNAAKVLSAITHYTALAISPQLKKVRLKHIQLIPLDATEILLVLVGEKGIVKNTMFKVEQEIPDNQLNRITNFLNHRLKGLTIDHIGKTIEKAIIEEMYEFKDIIDKIIPIIDKSLETMENVEVYSDGITKIFDFPEYKDLDKARSFISFIEDKELLFDLLMNNPMENWIEITIGGENIYEPLKDCSVITTTYKLGDMTIGRIGVIGPTRMDYATTINALQLFSMNLTEILTMLMGKK